MKKLICLLTAILVVGSSLTACSINKHTHSYDEWETVKVATATEDGEKVRYCGCGEKQSQIIYATGEGEDKGESEDKVETAPEITIDVMDGYLAVNGVKTEYKVYSEPVISIIDGYVAVNGVKTEYYVSTSCEHIWSTVTTAPTCTEGGYDTMTCSLCDKVVKVNSTSKLDHTYGEAYMCDSNNHWYQCTGCDATKGIETHTVDDDGICTVCQTPVSATPGVVYDISADGTYAEVIDYTGNAINVKIASEYNSLPVTKIYTGAFSGTSIQSIVIPNSVTAIGGEAFKSCANLTTVVIPDSVTSISYNCFSSCSNLKSVTIPNSVTYIESNVFSGCSSLTSVVIPDSVKKIPDSAFYNCSSLTSVTIGSGVTAIGSSAFAYCRSLISVVIPKNVTDIGYSAFSYCSNLSSVEITDSIKNVGRDAFANCHSSLYTEYEYGKYVGSQANPHAILIGITNNVMSSYTIHEDTINIATYAISKCSRLTSITIPDSVASISSYAFDCGNTYNENVSLQTVVIGKGVKYIGFYAFYNLKSMTSLIIQSSEIYIDGSAFVECSNIKDVYYIGGESEWNEIAVADWNKYFKNATIHYNYVIEE